MTDPRIESKDAAAAMLKVLNEHGHAYSASVLRHAHGTDTSVGQWDLRSTEFPGELRGTVFHVDGVLELRRSPYVGDLVLAAVECKRVDPSVSRWCFIRTSAVRGEDFQRHPLFDRYSLPAAHQIGMATQAEARVSYVSREQVYQHGEELKTREKGNGTGKSLKNALAQSCRGASGLVARLREWQAPSGGAYVVPVVATTAELLVSAADLATADLKTGRMPSDSMALTPVPWLWYEMHLTPDLSPEVGRARSAYDKLDPVGYTLDHECARTVLITRGTEIRAALRALAVAVAGVDRVPS